VVFFGTILARALALAGEAIIIRSLAPDAFGQVALAYTVVLTVSQFALLGVPNGVTRLLSTERTREEELHVLRSGFLIVLTGATIVALAVFAFRSEIAALMNEGGMSPLLALFVPFILVAPIGKVAIAVLRARGRSARAMLSQKIGPRVGALSLFAVLALAGEPFYGAVAFWVMIPIVTACSALSFMSRELSLLKIVRRLPDKKTVRELWSFSWPLAISASFLLFLSNLDVLMVGYFLSPVAVGYYRSVMPLRQVTRFVLLAFRFLFLPLATKYYDAGEFDELDELYTISTKWTVAATLPPVLAIALFSPTIVRLLFGAEYLPGAPVLTILTLGLFFVAVVGPTGPMIQAIDRPRAESISAAAGFVTNATLNVLLIPRLGIIGAAVATVVGYGVYNSVEVVVIYRETNTHPFSANSLKPIVPTTLVGLCLVWLTTDYTLGPGALVGIGIVLSVTQLVSMIVTRSLDDADLFLLERIENRTDIDLAWLKSTIRGRS
jgi:O-antigen/teichoic acid export membrane protein